MRIESRDVSDEQTNWNIEFKETGETQVRQNLLNRAIYNNNAKYTFALEWLREQEATRELRERRIFSYAQRTFWAAVAAVVVGVIGVVATLIH
jgi:hypothetical protein